MALPVFFRIRHDVNIRFAVCLVRPNLLSHKSIAIRAGHDAALAGVVAISDPTPTTVAVEAALLAATDLTGLEYARQKLATRRAELEAMVEAATTVEVLDAVVVSYPV